MIDKLFLVNKGLLVIYFTHRPPVSISGPDALSLYNWLYTPAKVVYIEFRRRVAASLEETNAA